MTRNLSLAVLAALLLGLSGCGAKLVDVHGRVTYNGSPLTRPNGQIVFVGPDGTQVASAIGLDGTYQATSVPVGLNRIAVYYPNPAAQQGKLLLAQPKKGERLPAASAAPPFLTPSRFASVDSSNLSVQVEEDTVFNADLTGPTIR
jgi:hypothetical protein